MITPNTVFWYQFRSHHKLLYCTDFDIEKIIIFNFNFAGKMQDQDSP